MPLGCASFTSDTHLRDDRHVSRFISDTHLKDDRHVSHSISSTHLTYDDVSYSSIKDNIHVQRKLRRLHPSNPCHNQSNINRQDPIIHTNDLGN